MPASKNAKITAILNHRVRCTLQDGRQLVGTFKAFDRHMNLIFCDCDEFRLVKNKKAEEEKKEKRSLGLILLRGEHIVSLNVDGPPPPEDNPRVPTSSMPPGMGSLGAGRAVGRGMSSMAYPPPMAMPTSMPPPPPGAPIGLAGPAYGVGGPAPGMMQPRTVNPLPPGYGYPAPPPPPGGR